MLSFIRIHTAVFQAYLDAHGLDGQTPRAGHEAIGSRFRIQSIELVAPRTVDATGEHELAVYFTVVSLDGPTGPGRTFRAEAICTDGFEDGTFRGAPTVRSVRLATSW